MLISRPRPLAPTDSTGAAASGTAAPRPARVDAQVAGLDAQALARLCALDPRGESLLLKRVLQAFQGSAARLMPQLAAAHLQGDRNAIRLVAHTLKSSSASIGALALSQRCAQLETAIRLDTRGHFDHDHDHDHDLDIAALRQAMAAALQSIDRLLTEPPE